jgi:hypothetical protein
MMRLQVIFVLGHVILLAIAGALYVSDHGGAGGDYVSVDSGNDVATDPADLGRVLFNRWRLDPQKESWLVQLFLCLNVPSLAAAKLVVSSVDMLWPEMRVGFPFGLSYASYIAVLGGVLSFAQWYWLGRFSERRLNGRR